MAPPRRMPRPRRHRFPSRVLAAAYRRTAHTAAGSTRHATSRQARHRFTTSATDRGANGNVRFPRSMRRAPGHLLHGKNSVLEGRSPSSRWATTTLSSRGINGGRRPRRDDPTGRRDLHIRDKHRRAPAHRGHSHRTAIRHPMPGSGAPPACPRCCRPPRWSS